jgi:hypothetical protein
MEELSLEEKRRILLEEKYREEVRKALQPEKSKRQRVAEFANSPFAIWLLSSVVLAGLTSLWALIVTMSTTRTAAQARFERVMVEIDYRLTTFDRALDRYGREDGFTLIGALSPITDPVHLSGGFAGTPAFPEFEQRTVNSLLIELKMGADHKRKNRIERILKALQELQSLRGMEDNAHPLPLASRGPVLQNARDRVADLRKILYEA